ncbi:M48 family metallopeptidase [Amycolatopsis vancoresmycina]|uniref:M48 family metallopeptidase n=1 Tax=Amycolatopsis vancoresmycina TaxID=208444 RepID=UPI000524C0CB|nr:M48 family metallopeptidase [Amycolatopsis vancoresmycina]
MAVNFQLRDLMHPMDRTARSALEAVPLLQTAVAAYSKVYSDKVWRHFLLSNAVRLGPRQLPEYYRMLPPICDALGIAVPEMYLMAGQPNAMTIGREQPMIVLYSELLECLDEQEVRAVIAHECGHIAFDHVLYRQMAQLAGLGGVTLVSMIPGVKQVSGVAMLALQETLLNWQRKSELSADRAAAMCTGGPDAMRRAIFHMVGIPKWLPGDVDIEEFEAQTHEFDAFKSNSVWNKLINYETRSMSTHPVPIARVKYLQDWTKSDSFRILTGAMDERRQLAGARCAHCHVQIRPDWRFCQACGTPVTPVLEARSTPAALEGRAE